MLRVGDTVPLTGKIGALARDSGTRTNKFTTEGMMRMAWRSLGSCAQRCTSGLALDGTHHDAQCLADLAALAHEVGEMALGSNLACCFQLCPSPSLPNLLVGP